MDIRVKNRVTEMQQALDIGEQRISLADPVAKMMLVAMAHQSCEIERKIDETTRRLAGRFCDEVLQTSNMRALPAITVARIGNGKETVSYYLDENDSFTDKPNKCIFRPIFRTRIVPGCIVACFMGDKLLQPNREPINATWPDARHYDEVWFAYKAFGETNTLEDVVLALSHPLPTDGLTVEVGDATIQLTPLMESIPRTLNSNFMLTEFWKKRLVHYGLWLYKFGRCSDKRILHRSEIPAWIRDSYSSEILEDFVGQQYMWIRIKAAKSCCLPLNTAMFFNCIPLANYDIQNITLSYSEPIQSLENENRGIFFIGVDQNKYQGQKYFIRDFDVSQYDNERIREDVTSLYHHYVNDYYAFVDSNALHDGATLRSLRKAMMQVYDSLDEFQTDSLRPYGGVYAIRNPKNSQEPIVLTYFTSNGGLGNELKAGERLTPSNAAPGDVETLINASGGRDKITGRLCKQELVRYEVNSNDRLFTRMDLLQYCKIELMRAFGDDAANYCSISLEDGNMVVDGHIEKCVTIHFKFSSDKLREAAQNSDFFSYLKINIDLRKSFSWMIKFG